MSGDSVAFFISFCFVQMNCTRSCFVLLTLYDKKEKPEGGISIQIEIYFVFQRSFTFETYV